MGSNKNKNKTPAPAQSTQPSTNNSPVASSDIFKQSGDDPRGRVQNRILDESSRYRGQIDPFINDLGRNWGDSLGQSNQDYGDIMSRFQDVAGSNPIQARSVSYTDPFKSYGDYEGLSKTGGYSAADIADLRARGASPVRAAYANAEREVGRQRSLQGGYSPNATAVLAKMAREQSQGAADALQNVNAGIIADRNRGMQAGMAGMAGIEGQRLGAQIDTGKFNANAQMSADQYNNQNRMDALRGMTSLYGTTPARANMFGQQLGQAINNSGQQGTSYFTGENNAQNQPGSFDSKMDKFGQVYNTASTVGAPLVNYFQNRNKQQQTGGNAVNGGFMGPQQPANYWDPTQWQAGDY